MSEMNVETIDIPIDNDMDEPQEVAAEETYGVDTTADIEDTSLQPTLSVDIVGKIARNDPEYMETSDDALVATAFATELFIKTLTNESLLMADFHPTNNAMNGQSSENNDGTNNDDSNTLTYDNLSYCVKKKGNFQFLGDLIPMTKNLKDLVQENKVRYTTALPQGQLLGN
ncbi:hypothetical protein NCAS_0A09230 [Naumovozyma castellii]|uniref:Transcription factor CBF/NF-Y/archaeal histone domain-containing protein n=1 Tax=Naumovozyma castellii TaxID=27288 RepID=G0V7N3_NAUCA|nr:hypothetical protein NCAS_0A09230 [Naumovozyma castellii CBS 4309]CCC67481.1 hypothetical protein NCAS_0A09230 [Naumovozyma castellii CBS 4309]